MELLADGLLIATTLTAAIYCAVLGRRLRRLGSSDEGLGARLAALDATVEETRAAVAEARHNIDTLKTASGSVSERLKRDLAQARRLHEDLEAAADRAAGLLDRLLRIEPGPRPVQPSPAAEFEIVSAQEDGRVEAEAAPLPASAGPLVALDPGRPVRFGRMGL